MDGTTQRIQQTDIDRRAIQSEIDMFNNYSGR